MDNLARNAMLAKEAGMSYGQWKALQPVAKYEKQVPEGFAKCEWCGTVFRKKPGKRFCEIGCRVEAAAERKRKVKLRGKA